MFRLHLLKLVAIPLSFLCPSAFAQKTTAAPLHEAAAVKSELPNRTLDLTHVESLVGLPAASVTDWPICSSDGAIFTEVYAVSGKPEFASFPEIYSVSRQREIKKIKLPVPTGYKAYVLGSIFPAKNRLLAFIQADQPIDPDTPHERGKLTTFLATVDRDGDQPNIVKLDLPFEPLKAAIFDSGEFLVLGTDTINLKPVLAVLHGDGSLERMLDLDARTYESSQDLKQIYKPRENDSNTDTARRVMTFSLGAAAQFIPWGDDILLVQRGSKLPVYRFHNAALAEAVTFKLPDGFLVDTILGSSEKDTWVVVSKELGAFQKVMNRGVVENPTQHLYEVNPHTGEVIDQLSVKGPLLGAISCAADSKLSAIYFGPAKANAPDQLVYASAPR